MRRSHSCFPAATFFRVRINGWPKVDSPCRRSARGKFATSIRRCRAERSAARPRSPDSWRTAPPLRACAPHARLCAGRRAVIGRSATLAITLLGVSAVALPSGRRPPAVAHLGTPAPTCRLVSTQSRRSSGVHAGDLVVVRPPKSLALFFLPTAAICRVAYRC